MINLEYFDKEHCTKLISWIKSEEDLMQFAGPNLKFPLTENQITTELLDVNRVAFSIFVDQLDDPIGHAQILIQENSFKLGRILIGENRHRGKGYGLMIVNELLKYGFETLGIDQAELNVFDWNTSAIKVYEKAGFIIRPDQNSKRLVNGKEWTAINMVLHKL